MKRYFFFAVLLTIVTCFATSCQKEVLESTIDNPVFTATIDQFATNSKTTLATGDYVYWVENDQISVNGAIYQATTGGSASTSFTYVSGTTPASPYKAYYPASLYKDADHGTLPYIQTYEAGKISNLPMYAEGSDLDLNFHNICGVIELKLQASSKSVSSIAVTSASTAINGDFTVTDNVATLSAGTLTAAQKTVVLNCGTGVDISSETKFWIAVPQGSHQLTFRVNTTDGKSYVKSMTSAKQINANNIYPITGITSWNEEQFTSGPFQVSSTRTLRFAKGNLKYDGSTYSISPNPWDYVSSTTPADRQNVDLFQWTSLQSSYTIGGKTWIVPTRADWEALIGTTRTGSTVSGTANCRFAKVTLGGVKGVLFCPDGVSFSLPSGVTISNWNNTNSDFPSIITTGQWATFDAAGCIFLPAAGYCQDGSIQNAGSAGRYWSTTVTYSGEPDYLYIASENVCIYNFSETIYFSVRPAQAM